MLFTACKKDDPAANVYLKKVVFETNVAGLQAVTNEYVWDNNLLMAELSTTVVMGMPIVVSMYYEYEGNNVVHTYSFDDRGDTIHHYYAYENGRLKTFDTDWGRGTITSYSSNGEITSYEDVVLDVARKYELEWRDGNMVKARENRVYPDGTKLDTTYEFFYDDKVSAYSNMPIVQAVEGVDVMGLRASKNNMLFGLPLGGCFIDIGIPEDYYRAQTLIPDWVAKESNTI